MLVPEGSQQDTQGQELPRPHDEISSNAPSVVKPTSSDLERMFRKYVSVWVWSVIFGMNTGLTFNLTTQTQRWGDRGLVLVGIYLVSVITITLSWIALLGYLSDPIIPALAGRIDSKENYLPSSRVFLLHRALALAIVATFLRLFIGAIEMTLMAVSSFGDGGGGSSW
jgi:hypothetical protein